LVDFQFEVKLEIVINQNTALLPVLLDNRPVNLRQPFNMFKLPEDNWLFNQKLGNSE